MARPLLLGEALDLRAAAPLLEEIRARRGAALQMDGSAVGRLGGQCLQVLLAARAAWAEDGHDFAILNPSTALKEGWVLMGADPSSLMAPPETPS